LIIGYYTYPLGVYRHCTSNWVAPLGRTMEASWQTCQTPCEIWYLYCGSLLGNQSRGLRSDEWGTGARCETNSYTRRRSIVWAGQARVAVFSTFWWVRVSHAISQKCCRMAVTQHWLNDNRWCQYLEFVLDSWGLSAVKLDPSMFWLSKINRAAKRPLGLSPETVLKVYCFSVAAGCFSSWSCALFFRLWEVEWAAVGLQISCLWLGDGGVCGVSHCWFPVCGYGYCGSLWWLTGRLFRGFGMGITWAGWIVWCEVINWDFGKGQWMEGAFHCAFEILAPWKNLENFR